MRRRGAARQPFADGLGFQQPGGNLLGEFRRNADVGDAQQAAGPGAGELYVPPFRETEGDGQFGFQRDRVQRAGVAIQPRRAVYGEDRGPGQIGGRRTILFDEFIIEQAREFVRAYRVITDDRAGV